MNIVGQISTAWKRLSGAPALALNYLGEMPVSEVLPRLSNMSKVGQSFSARGGAQLLSVAGIAMTGLQVWNSSTPGTTAVDLHVTVMAGDVIVTSATMTGIAIAYGTGQVAAPTGATAATVLCDNIGLPFGQGKAYTAGTFALAPTVAFDVLHNTAAIGTTGEDAGFLIPVDGRIIVPPNCWIAFVAVGAASAAAATNLNFAWGEFSS